MAELRLGRSAGSRIPPVTAAPTNQPPSWLLSYINPGGVRTVEPDKWGCHFKQAACFKLFGLSQSWIWNSKIL